MKKIYSILAAGVLGSAFLSSCSDFLTEDPKGQMAPESFYTSANDLDMAVNALYYNVALSQCNSNPFIPQCQGSDITSTTGSNKAAYLSADAFTKPSEYKGVDWIWLWQYNIIQASNQIVDNYDRCKTTQEHKNIALGNALFWRACAYFQLVRLFGPLPVNLHNEDDNNSTPLSSVEDIYKMIMEDLDRADKLNLPTSYEGQTYGREGNCNLWISQQAVKSLMCAVYMNMAGYPLNLGTEYYKRAADKAKEVIDGVNNGTYPHALESNWNQVYSYGNNFSSEQIVTISYYAMPGTMGGNSNYVSQMPLCHQFTQFSGWGDFIPERSFWSKYPEGPRKDAVYDPMIRMTAKDVDGNNLLVDWWATKDEQPYNGKTGSKTNCWVEINHPKFSSLCANADPVEGMPLEEPYDYRKPYYMGQSLNLSHRIIRYSEVLCWFAESAARAGVYTSEAEQALQQVQARAYAPGYTPDNSDLAEAAYREHGYEVAGYPLALVTVRADEFRMDRLKDVWEFRRGPQNNVLVPKGTVTHSFKEEKVKDPTTGRTKYVNTPYTYELTYDVVLPETMDVSETWDGENSIYMVYPPTETEKNPNIKR